MGLFGGTKISTKATPRLTQQQVQESEQQARAITAATPEELAMLAKLGVSADQADAGMLEQIRALGERGEDLSNVDQGYMERAYQPAFERMMLDYGKMDQGIIENMNKRGIASVPGGESEPENYQRRLLARDTKESLGRTMLDAQNQAVQQKLSQYNARLAEPNLATTRYGQTMGTLQNARIVPESERMQTRAGTAGNIYNAKMGLAANQLQSQTAQKLQQNQNSMNMIGGGLGVASSLIGSLGPLAAIGMVSKPEMKKNIGPGPDPEKDLAEISDIPVDRWQYRWEDEGAPMHEGAMADQVPEDMQAPAGIDVPSYLGKLTNAVKVLNQKMSAYERLLQGGQANGL